MNPSRFSKLITLLMLVMAVGCSRDPNVRKQKYLESGMRYMQEGKYPEASIQLQNAIKIDPRFADAHYEFAQCLMNMGNWRGAYGELMRTIDIAPDNLKAQVDVGKLLLLAKQFDQAREKADLVLSKDPNNIDAHILRADALATLQGPEASVQEMQKTIELNPDQPRAYLNMGVLELSAKQAAAAEESFKKAISLDPKSVPARVALGNFYAGEQRWPDAEAQYRSSIALDPHNLSSRIALIGLYLQQKQDPQAIQAAQEAKAAFKDSSQGYRLLGDLYFRIGNTQAALDEYTALYKEHPRDLEVKRNLIQLLLAENRMGEAAKLNDEILKSNPNDGRALITRGQILVHEGHPADAIAPLQTALRGRTRQRGSALQFRRRL